MPLDKDDAMALIKKRHPEWEEFQKSWRWLQDSYEGGNRYRNADYFRGPFDPAVRPWYAYGFDATTGVGYPVSYGQLCERNLVPHQSETTPENRDIYALRLRRTPVPAIVSRVVRRYLSRIFSKPVTREGTPELDAWWADCDGQGTSIDQWVRKTTGPMLLTLGQLDVVLGRPEAPEGLEVRTKAQARRLGLDGVVADYILPENLVWWSLDLKKQYRECLVCERCDDGNLNWRHWTAEGSDLYTSEGDHVPERSWMYDYGRPPIVRVFDDKKLRCKNVGQSRLEVIAELQMNVYNRRSELILADIFSMHPVLQGPEEYMEADSKVPMGPGGSLPKKRSKSGDSYEGWELIAAPQLGVAECRVHINDDMDEVLSEAAMTKPAGSTTGPTVAQSGVSKSFDAREGNDVLSEIATTLRDFETAIAKLAMLVLHDGAPRDTDVDAIRIDYPREYNLFTASDLAVVISDIQGIVAAAGALPEVEAEVLKRLIADLLPGLDPDRMSELHAEIDETVRSKAVRRDQSLEAEGDEDGEDDSGAGGDINSTMSPSFSLPVTAGQDVDAVNLALAGGSI